jgi:hypothetical protein
VPPFVLCAQHRLRFLEEVLHIFVRGTAMARGAPTPTPAMVRGTPTPWQATEFPVSNGE